MINLIKSYWYRFNRSHYYYIIIILSLITGFLALGAFMDDMNFNLDQLTHQLSFISLYKTASNYLLFTLPLIFIHFFYRRQNIEKNIPELLVVKKRYKIILIDLFFTFIVSFVIYGLTAVVLRILLSHWYPFAMSDIENIFIHVISITIMSTTLTSFANMFLNVFKSFVIAAMMDLLVVTGNMHILVKLILIILGYQQYSKYTLSGIFVSHHDNFTIILLLMIYIIVYTTITIILTIRKDT